MQIVAVKSAGSAYYFKWPEGSTETYRAWVDYETIAEDGKHEVKVGFATRETYGKERERVVVWIDGYPAAEFVGADDFEASGEVLSEIRLKGERGEPMCRYPDHAVPERYSAFTITGLPNRIQAKGVRSAWAVVANVSDHKTMIALTALRTKERE